MRQVLSFFQYFLLGALATSILMFFGVFIHDVLRSALPVVSAASAPAPSAPACRSLSATLADARQAHVLILEFPKELVAPALRLYNEQPPATAWVADRIAYLRVATSATVQVVLSQGDCVVHVEDAPAAAAKALLDAAGRHAT